MSRARSLSKLLVNSNGLLQGSGIVPASINLENIISSSDRLKLARAWITFDGVALTTKESYNFNQTISRPAQGNFELTLSSPMPTSTFPVLVTLHNSDNGGGGATYPNFTTNNVYIWGWSTTTSTIRIRTAWGNNANYNGYHITAVVFGGNV